MYRTINIVVASLLLAFGASAHSETYEVEACQYSSEDQANEHIPPGLDEPLNCDHKDFYEELNLSVVSERLPTLDDMYSIGWRLVELVKSEHQGRAVWNLYFERQDKSSNPE